MKNRIAALAGAVSLALIIAGCGDDGTTLSKLKTSKYVTLGEYTGLTVEVPAKTEVTPEYLQNYIDYIRSQSMTYEEMPEDYEAQEGDYVNIDYVGKIDGVAFDGGTAQGYDLQLGSHTFIDGFEDGLIGAKTGETRDVTTTFPVPYQNNMDLSGKEAIFTVTVNSVEQAKMPELTDEYVASLGVGCETVDDYKDYCSQLLDADAQDTYDRNVNEAILDAVMDNCEFKDPPEAMIDQYYDRAVRRITKTASQYGVSLEQFVTQYFGTTMDDFKEQARDGAITSCKESIMLQDIANRENITVSDEEVDKALEDAAALNGYDSVEDLKAEIGEDHYEDYVMSDKALAFLKENNTVTDVDTSAAGDAN